MKKLPDDYLLRQARIADSRAKSKKHYQESTYSGYSSNRKRKKGKKGKKGKKSNVPYCRMPSVFSTDYKYLNSTIDSIQEFGRKRGLKKVIVDFSNTESMSAMALLYMHSEFKKTRAFASLRIIRPRRNILKKILGETKFLDLHPEGAPGNNSSSIAIVQGTNDAKLDFLIENIIKRDQYYQQLEQDNKNEAEFIMQRALSEAMLNVKQHAYKDDVPKTECFWWLIATAFMGKLYVVICDRGMGIPKSLPRKGLSEIMRGLMPGKDAHHMIKRAMEYARTSEQHTGRGLGSADIQRLIRHRNSGYLTIISGRGYYHMDGKSKNISSKNIKYDIQGTLIEWCIDLISENS